MSDGGEKTCPLCAEEMDLTDQQLKPCKCGYEICIWCWHHIMDMAEKDDTEGRCPACRTPYDKEKIVGMASNCERLVTEINMERKKSQKAKIKPFEGRKQLSSVRIIQRNLVYVVGLPLNLADEDLLQRREFFGQYGKVLKVSMSRTAAGIIQQFPNNTCSVYITYSREEEAIRCIQSVHGFVLDGRALKACFGTTKYCHAWLRNVPCTNPDCLYLHEIGSQEDSFTKDEIISAYTRSRVQQITAATSKMLRSGNTLPPPVDGYGNNTSLAAARPIIKNTSNSTISSSKGSPPNGSLGRSVALPPAASWGMRASNQLLVGNSTCANGSSKTKTDAVCGALAFSKAVSSTSQTSTLHSDVGIKVTWDEDCEINDGKSKLDSLKLAKHNVGADCQATISEKPAKNLIATTELTSSNPLSKNDWSTTVSPNITNSALHTAQSCVPEKVGTAATNGKIDKLCSDMPSLSIDTNVRSETSGLLRTNSSPCDFSMIKSPVSRGIQHPYSDQYREQFSSPATECTARPVNGACVLNEQFDQRTDSQTQSFDESVSEVEDIISFDNQRLKDPEVVTLTNCLPNSSNSLPFSIHSRSHSLRDSVTFGAVDLNADHLYLDNRGGEHSLLNASSNSVIPNGCTETVSSSARPERPIERSFLLPSGKKGRDIGRLQSDVGSISASDAGENSIISNILSLDSDAWDESLTSPQNLSKFLRENDQQPSSLRMSSSWKAQNNGQSRFSFAREEGARNQALDLDSSVSIFGHFPRNHSFRQYLVDGQNSHMDKTGMGNGFVARNYEEPEIFTSGAPVFTSNKSSVSRTQASTPPGFSAPNRAPPPGFSSHERMDQHFDAISGSHLLDSSPLLRNSYQAPPPGNIGSNADIEFMDPAILAVGKGKLHGGLNNPVLDMRSNFPPHSGDFENEARLQLLMQRSLSSHQNLRYADIGDSFSSPSDPYGIPSRLVDQSQVSNLSPLAHLSLQQSRNGLTSNGHWYSWNEIQGGNNLAVTELVRNERLGYNKFYTTGYENSKFQMPSSGDLYSRAFEM